MKHLVFGTQPKYDRIAQAFAETLDHVYFPATRRVNQWEDSEWVGFDQDKWIESKNPIVVVGILRGTAKLLKLARIHKIPYYFIDHAYFYRGHGEHPILKDTYYRVTKNNEYLNEFSSINEHRDLIQRNINLLTKVPIRTNIDKYYENNNGKYILVFPPSKHLCKYWDIPSVEYWIDEVHKNIKTGTDREIIVCSKDNNIKYQDYFPETHCMVSFTSTAPIEGILQGIPSIAWEVSMLAPVSWGYDKYADIEKIRTFEYRGRRKERGLFIAAWRDHLLSNQFSMTEMKSGFAKQTVDRLQKGLFNYYPKDYRRV